MCLQSTIEPLIRGEVHGFTHSSHNAVTSTDVAVIVALRTRLAQS